MVQEINYFKIKSNQLLEKVTIIMAELVKLDVNGNVYNATDDKQWLLNTPHPKNRRLDQMSIFAAKFVLKFDYQSNFDTIKNI